MAVSEHQRLFAERLNDVKTTKVSNSVCVCKVPKYFKDTDESAYIPELVGLGPLHHLFESPSIPNLRSFKFEAVKLFLEQCSPSSSEAITDVFAYVERKKDEIQGYYHESFDVDSAVFILDSCFVLQICLSLDEGALKSAEAGDSFHPVFNCRSLKRSLGHLIIRDVLKLENQLPLFFLLWLLERSVYESREFEILFWIIRFSVPFAVSKVKEKAREILCDEVTPPRHALEWLQRVMSHFIWPSGTVSQHKERSNDSCFSPMVPAISRIYSRGIRNDLSLPRSRRDMSLQGGYDMMKKEDKSETPEKTFAPKRASMPKDNVVKGKVKPIPRAVDLATAGVTFRKGAPLSFQENCFHLRGTLTLPKLHLNDNTEYSFRNVMAFEECFLQKNSVSQYVAFMDSLIDKESDVGLLCKAEVIRSTLQSHKEVANLFNRLGVYITKHGIAEIEEQMGKRIRKHHRSSKRRMVKEFIEIYFSKPWHACTTFAALVILLCTVMQAIYAVKGANQQNKLVSPRTST